MRDTGDKAKLALGIDPGLANFGFALVDISSNPMKVLRMGVMTTSKSKGMSVSEDMFRRAADLAGRLYAFCYDYLPGNSDLELKIVCPEAMSYPRQSQAAAKIAMSWGVMAGIFGVYEIPVHQVSPQKIKSRVCGIKSAGKSEVREALEGIFDLEGTEIEKINESKKEHAFDALGAVVACLDLDLLAKSRKKEKAK